MSETTNNYTPEDVKIIDYIKHYKGINLYINSIKEGLL
jgi:DNA-binding transcriptional MerR regulator